MRSLIRTESETKGWTHVQPFVFLRLDAPRVTGHDLWTP